MNLQNAKKLARKLIKRHRANVCFEIKNLSKGMYRDDHGLRIAYADMNDMTIYFHLPYVLAVSKKEFIHTILHEIAHMLTWYEVEDHGKEWLQVFQRLMGEIHIDCEEKDAVHHIVDQEVFDAVLS